MGQVERLATVGVVICAYDEEAHIGRLLRSLKAQTLRPSEVIVVDDGSRDRTASIADREGVRVIRLPHRGPALGKNIGTASARTDIVVFLDGDMACGPRFLERLTAPIRTEAAVGTFTRDIYVGNPENRWAAAYAVMRRLRNGRLLPDNGPPTWDNFRAIRRDAFLSVGGYDDVGYGEDRTVSRKLGSHAVAADDAVCFHFNPSSPTEIFFNGRWIGRGPQIREIDPPWRDHLPHRVARWLARDLRELPPATAVIARAAYHLGVLIGLAESTIDPRRHWK
jgi:glycosyltransferase involved in cell wall biosynthesis